MSASFWHRLLVAPLPFIPRPIVWRLSRRYVAGTRLADAFNVVAGLNGAGCGATIDVLGEDSTTVAEVSAAAALYEDALAGIAEAGLDCNASVKLSDMGLRFDTRLCTDTMRSLVDLASRRANFVRIDMEDSSVTTATLDLYRELRREHANVGAVIQSCLRRSERDVQRLLDESIANVRICKGIYVEPEQIAYNDAGDIRCSYERILMMLLEGGAEMVAIATHDPVLVQRAESALERLAVPRERYEFQMLLGVAGPLRERLVQAGHPLRVYVPFGERWYAYSLRRLRENPQIAMHIAANLLRRG